MENKEIAQREEKKEDVLELLNGAALKCYCKDSVQKTMLDDEVNLDSTGAYLRLKDKRQAKKEQEEYQNQIKKQEADNLRFFLDYAFMFLHNADAILNDSRMFLAPVPVHSVLAYSGGSGFSSPTLGVYIEWWIQNKSLVCRDRKGDEVLTYLIAGSPLSGSNRCRCVYPDGTSELIIHDEFLKVWSSFVGVNSRYGKAKQMYCSYTLQEVVERLESRKLPEFERLTKEIQWQEDRCQSAQQHLAQQKEKTRQLEERYRVVSLRLCEFLLKPLVEEYRVRHAAFMVSEEQFQGDKSSCKVRFASGEISSDEYQRMLTPFSKKRKAGRMFFVDYVNEQVARISAEEHIPTSIIWEYLDSQGCPRV